MEMYLKKDDKDIFRFPILPSAINIQDYAIINDSNITGLGDVTIFGGKGLRTIEISSFFPNPKRKYSFVSYTDYPKQYECVNKIKKWMDKGEMLLSARDARQYKQGKSSSPQVNIVMNGTVIRENADIEKIASALVRKINEQRIITNG